LATETTLAKKRKKVMEEALRYASSCLSKNATSDRHARCRSEINALRDRDKRMDEIRGLSAAIATAIDQAPRARMAVSERTTMRAFTPAKANTNAMVSLSQRPPCA
jgi:hypothetical protein